MKQHYKSAFKELFWHIVVAMIVFVLCWLFVKRVDLPLIVSAIIIAGGFKNAVMTKNHESRKE